MSKQLISFRRKSKGCPEGRNVDEWRLFLATTGREESVPKELRLKIAQQKLRTLTALANKAERDDAKAAGMMLDRGDVEFTARKAMALLFSSLDRMGNVEWPAELKGKDERGIQVVVGASVEQLKAQFKEGLKGQLNGEKKNDSH